MRVILKDAFSADVDPATYWPENEDSFGYYLQAIIGPADGEGGEAFGFLVCTPKFLATVLENQCPRFLNSTILVDKYCWEAVIEHIQDLCRRTSGTGWIDVAGKLSRFGDWEFADYQPLEPKH